ncbi:MAG: aminoglycoside phosphotransferase family protein [Lentisphaeria bacterium]|nr:aminoglycoside phosphotransferase family protein [Lentisphaeria bacterium]NQZ68436.1 aminoglycoside phosphotransferase family protein [Lentisphaeria bacterium]
MAIEPATVIALVENFRTGQRFSSVEQWHVGHINDTFLVKTNGIPFAVLQRINHDIFKSPVELMDNMLRITNHIRGKLAASGADAKRGTLQIFQTNDGRHVLESEGNYWRLVRFIDGAYSIDVIENNDQAYEAARTFGEFQNMLVDLSGPRLYDTIPNFHNTKLRFQEFEDAVKNDLAERAKECPDEIDFILSRKNMSSIVVDALAAGELPERITHNDNKINNVMFDSTTHKGLAAIDLDTVMPGSALYDFGDMVRTAAGSFEENETDLSKIFIIMDRYEALVEGYLSAAKFLTAKELELLSFGGRLITFEQAFRFLADYLNGDSYYKTSHETENLDRARSQIAFLSEMEKHQEEMEEIVRKTVKSTF